jgi:biopolymer transport protein ExbD
LRRIDADGKQVRARNYNEKFEKYSADVKCGGTIAETFYDADFTVRHENSAKPDFAKFPELIKSSAKEYRPPRDEPDKKMPVVIDSGELVSVQDAVRAASIAKSMGMSDVALATQDEDWKGCPKNERKDFVEKLWENKPIILYDTEAMDGAKYRAARAINILNDYKFAAEEFKRFLDEYSDSEYANEAADLAAKYEKEAKKIEDSLVAALPKTSFAENDSGTLSMRMTIGIILDNAFGHVYVLNGVKLTEKELTQKFQIVKSESPFILYRGKGSKIIVKADACIALGAFFTLYSASSICNVDNFAFAVETGAGNESKTGLLSVRVPAGSENSGQYDFRIELETPNKSGAIITLTWNEKNFSDKIKSAQHSAYIWVIPEAGFNSSGLTPLKDSLSELKSGYAPPKDKPEKAVSLVIVASETVNISAAVRIIGIIKSLGISDVTLAVSPHSK